MHCLSGISSRSVSGDRQITAVWKPTFGAAATRVLLLTARPGGQQRAAWGRELSSKCCCEEGDVLYCWFGGICCDLTLDRKTPVFLPFAGVVPRSPCPAVLLPVALVPRAEQGPKCQAQMSGFQPPETCRQSRAGVGS